MSPTKILIKKKPYDISRRGYHFLRLLISALIGFLFPNKKMTNAEMIISYPRQGFSLDLITVLRDFLHSMAYSPGV